MQIIAISPSRRNNQVWLKFDDQSFLPLMVDDIVVLRLKKFTDISADHYQKILINSANYLMMEYSLRQIAISPKVESILSQKLQKYSQIICQKYQYPPSVVSSQINQIISDIRVLGLLDEQKYLEYLQRRFPKKSIAELNYKLKNAGVSLSMPNSTLAETAKIVDIISKRYSNINYSDYNSRNKVVAKLYRKGFAIELIKNAIDEYQKIG